MPDNLSDLSSITDFIFQLEEAHTPFEIAKTVIRNFVGNFLPENAAFYIAPNERFPTFSLVEKYGIEFEIVKDLPSNESLINVFKKMTSVSSIKDLKKNELYEEEAPLLSPFDYVLPFHVQNTLYAVLFFNRMDDGSASEFDLFELELSKILNVFTANTFKKIEKPININVDSVTHLFDKDYLWSQILHHRHLNQALYKNEDVLTYSFADTQDTDYGVTLVSNNGSTEMVGFSLLLVVIEGLETLNKKYGFELGDKILKEFGLHLKLAMRRPDVPCRYGGGQFVILLPFTSQLEAEGMYPKIDSILGKLYSKNPELDKSILNIYRGSSHYPTHGQEGVVLVQVAESNLNK